MADAVSERGGEGTKMRGSSRFLCIYALGLTDIWLNVKLISWVASLTCKKE